MLPLVFKETILDKKERTCDTFYGSIVKEAENKFEKECKEVRIHTLQQKYKAAELLSK